MEKLSVLEASYVELTDSGTHIPLGLQLGLQLQQLELSLGKAQGPQDRREWGLPRPSFGPCHRPSVRGMSIPRSARDVGSEQSEVM